jgi:hypothetical protein
MTHEQILELLDDYVGGELPPREERDVRRHLMQCDPCRAEEQVLRTLLDEAAELPDAIPLPAWMLAAASVALVVTTSFATLRFSGSGDARTPTLAAEQANPPAQAGGPPTALASFQPAEQEYKRAIGDLQTALETRRSELAPQTVATLEENLRIIDHAIRESRAALAADPNRPELTRMLTDAYDAKLDVLRRAVSL